MRQRRVLLVCALALSLPATLPAQPLFARTEAPGRGTVEAGGGVVFSAGFDVPALGAGLTRSTGSDRFDLFSVDGTAGDSVGAHARVGFFVTRTISVEADFRYARPTLSYDLSDDAEAEDVTASETLSHYLFGGSVLFHLPGASFRNGRGMPFIGVGGGYIRELHEGNELVETGDEVHATVGVRYLYGAGRRRIAVRGEVGASSRHRGFDDEDARRTLPIALAGVSLLF